MSYFSCLFLCHDLFSGKCHPYPPEDLLLAVNELTLKEKNTVRAEIRCGGGVGCRRVFLKWWPFSPSWKHLL